MSLRGNALLLLVLMVILAIAGEWEQQGLLSHWWALPAALLLAGLGYESWLVRRAGVQLSVDLPAVLYLGRAAMVRFRLAHRLARTLTLQLAPAAPGVIDMDGDTAQLQLPAGTDTALARSVSPCRLGALEWPPSAARLAGALRLAWWSLELPAVARVRVLPDLVHDPAQLRSLAIAGTRRIEQSGSGAEVMRLREYRDGDAPRVIDWKATARSGRTISRDFAQEHGLRVLIMVDAGRASTLRSGQLDRYGHYANVASRLAQYAAAREDLVGLLVYADRPLASLVPARGAAAVARLRDLLGATQAAPAESNPVLAAARARELVRHRSLVVVLTDFDDVTAHGQLVQAVRLLQPKHLAFVAGLTSAAAEAMAVAPARHWLDPYRALAAQEYCAALERKVRALNALGAPALAARPAELERAVFAAYDRFCRQRRI